MAKTLGFPPEIPLVEDKLQDITGTMEEPNTDAMMVSILCIVTVIAIAVIFALVIYLSRCNKKRHGDPERDDSTDISPVDNTCNYVPSVILQEMMNFGLQASRLNPIYSQEELIFPTSEDVQRSAPPSSPWMNDQRESRDSREVSQTHDEQLTPLSPGDCSSGRCDFQLSELMIRDMKESVTVTVDTKLLVFISREIDHTGGHLVLDKMGISLFIPPCAIRQGEKQIIYLVLDWDLSDFPSMTSSQTIISPVVHCGPHGLRLHKPAILSFMHCAQDVDSVTVVTSETNLAHPKDWQAVGKPIEEGTHRYSLLPNNCQLYLCHFSLYTCLSDGAENSKWIQLVLFGDELKAGGRCQVFLYMLNNTPCALQFASQQEAKHDRVQMRCPLEFLYHKQGGDLMFNLKTLNEGWSSEGRKSSERGLFPDIWQGKCNNISFIFKHENPNVEELSFELEILQEGQESEKRSFPVLVSFPRRRRRVEPSPIKHVTQVHVGIDPSFLNAGVSDSGISGPPSENFSLKSTAQDCHSLAPSSDTSDPDYEKESDQYFDLRGCCQGQGYDNHNYHSDDDANVANSSVSSDERYDMGEETARKDHKYTAKNKGHESQLPLSQSSKGNTTINIHVGKPSTGRRGDAGLDGSFTDVPRPVLPQQLRKNLAMHLDPPDALWNDWRILAEALELDSMVPKLRTHDSPTDVLLDVAVRRGKDCRWLARVLRERSREDASREIDWYLESLTETCGQGANRSGS